MSLRSPDEIQGVVVIGGLVYASSPSGVRLVRPFDRLKRVARPPRAADVRDGEADAIYLDRVGDAIYRDFPVAATRRTS